MKIINRPFGKACGLGFLATGLLFAAASSSYLEAGTLTAVHSLSNGTGAPSVKANDGHFYGIRGTTFYKITSAGVYSTVATFSVGQVNSLIKGSDGNLYGTTWDGGSNGDGTVFQLTLTGTATVLADFYSGGSGHWPGRLLQASTGEFYGVTAGGGYYGDGTVFRLEEVSSVWTLTTARDLDASLTGSAPNSLIEGSDGYLYGTAEYGGTYGGGTLFQLDGNAGHISILKELGDSMWDGEFPAYIVEKEPGKFIGMTNGGGYFGRGMVYTYTQDLGYYTWMDLGEDYPDDPGYPNDGGYAPNGSPVMGTDGKLYGTMADGGNYYSASHGCGTLYRLTFNFSTYSYNLETLVEFSTSGSIGILPQESLTHDGSGSFHGTTSYGGGVFKFTP